MAAPVVSSIAPAIAPRTGGMLITATGTFAVGDTMRAYLGPLGTDQDPPCYSGASGSGFDVFSADGLTLQVVTPPSAKGALTLSVHSSGGDDTIAITIVERNWPGKTFRLRKTLPPWMETGPRSLYLEVRQ